MKYVRFGTKKKALIKTLSLTCAKRENTVGDSLRSQKATISLHVNRYYTIEYILLYKTNTPEGRENHLFKKKL